jgi:hypothetical protein
LSLQKRPNALDNRLWLIIPHNISKMEQQEWHAKYSNWRTYVEFEIDKLK